MQKIKWVFGITVFLGLVYLGKAQFIITNTLPYNYTQDFDTLGTNSVTPWVDDVTLKGWFLSSSTNGIQDTFHTNLLANGIFPDAKGIHFNYGASNSFERALGSMAGVFFIQPVRELYYGAQFLNGSSSTITRINISYTGEQWRDDNLTPQTIQFFTRVDGPLFEGNPLNTGWTAQPALNFVTPLFLDSGEIDGNNPTNQVKLNASINLNIAPGHSFWIRWFDANDMFADHGTGIDNVAITFDGINPSPAIGGIAIDLKKPKTGKKLVIKTDTGIKKIKGFVISESNMINKVSYAAFGGTNSPTNLTFIAAATKVPKPNSKLAKKFGVDLIFKSTKTTRPGADITSGPVTLLIKVEGGTSNSTAEVTFTNIFTDVKVK